VISAFRATGEGWQARMNDALRDWLQSHSPANMHPQAVRRAGRDSPFCASLLKL
jgi:hypothetical protein